MLYRLQPESWAATVPPEGGTTYEAQRYCVSAHLIVDKMRKILLIVCSLVLGANVVFAQGSNLVLKSADGQTIDLTNERGRVVVISFSANWAPLAAKELVALQRLSENFSGRPVSVYWVSINSAKQGSKSFASDADLMAFASRAGFRGKVLRDPDQAVYGSLGLNSIPTIVVLDKNGAVQRKHVGFDPDRDEALFAVTEAVDKALR